MVRILKIILLVVATVDLAGATPLFTDGFESAGLCSWPNEFAACGAGAEVVITLPGDTVTMTLAYVPEGTFSMGSHADERGRQAREDLHLVTLSQGYWMGIHEVTQGQWQAVMGDNPSDPANPSNCPTHDYGVSPDRPVFCVSWDSIAGPSGFMELLNQHLTTTGQPGAGLLRLPTEAEWERVARAGNQYRFSHGDLLECLDTCGACVTHGYFMWWCGNSGVKSHPVGYRLANAFGVFDMHGNVGEWVQDRYAANLGFSEQFDPSGPVSGAERVHRGGSWALNASFSRSASRAFYPPAYGYDLVGFRVASSYFSPTSK